MGGGKNPTARISLNILVNANWGNGCLKDLSMCWAAWAPGQEVLQLATSMPREGKDVLGLPGAPLGWQRVCPQRRENIPCEKVQLLWSCSLILMASTFAFAWRIHRVGWLWKDTGARNAAATTQRVCAQREALLEQDHKYSKKHFPDIHLGILIMNKCP